MLKYFKVIIMKDMLQKILSQLKENKAVVLMTIFKSSGSTPRKTGAKMACFCDFSILDTIGGGAIEHDAINCAKEMFKTKKSFSKTYTLNHNDAADLGMVCGGECSVYFQYIEPNDKNIEVFSSACKLIKERKSSWLITAIKDDYCEMGIYTKEHGYYFINECVDFDGIFKTTPQLSKNGLYFSQPLCEKDLVYIFGGGHIARALCPLLASCDFRVVVYEDNEDFAKKSLFPDAQSVICKSYLDIENTIDFKENDSAIVLTRGHKSDNEVIRQILSKRPFYLGVIGSKQKVFAMNEYLKSCGFKKSEIDSIHSPIGLKIYAQTPAEIAVSICAELIYYRATKNNPL